jgi:hypothetical protein
MVSASDADANVGQKQRQLHCCKCKDSLPDGHAKCCQVDALARQHANAIEHAIWVRHAEDRYSWPMRSMQMAGCVCMRLQEAGRVSLNCAMGGRH